MQEAWSHIYSVSVYLGAVVVSLYLCYYEATELRVAQSILLNPRIEPLWALAFMICSAAAGFLFAAMTFIWKSHKPIALVFSLASLLVCVTSFADWSFDRMELANSRADHFLYQGNYLGHDMQRFAAVRTQVELHAEESGEQAIWVLYYASRYMQMVYELAVKRGDHGFASASLEREVCYLVSLVEKTPASPEKRLRFYRGLLLNAQARMTSEYDDQKLVVSEDGSCLFAHPTTSG